MPKVQVQLDDYQNEIVSKLQKSKKGWSKERVIQMIISTVKLREVEDKDGN